MRMINKLENLKKVINQLKGLIKNENMKNIIILINN